MGDYGEPFLKDSPPEWAWKPTLQEFAELVSLAAQDKLCCAHNHFGRWTFWKPLGLSIVICPDSGQVYSVTVEGYAALMDLGVELEGGS